MLERSFALRPAPQPGTASRDPAGSWCRANRYAGTFDERRGFRLERQIERSGAGGQEVVGRPARRIELQQSVTGQDVGADAPHTRAAPRARVSTSVCRSGWRCSPSTARRKPAGRRGAADPQPALRHGHHCAAQPALPNCSKRYASAGRRPELGLALLVEVLGLLDQTGRGALDRVDRAQTALDRLLDQRTSALGEQQTTAHQDGQSQPPPTGGQLDDVVEHDATPFYAARHPCGAKLDFALLTSR